MINWKEALIRYFANGIKEDAQMRLGAEVEHFIMDAVTHKAVPYSGDNGVRKVITRLMDRYPDAEVLPDDDFFGFAAPYFTVTLEPAAQLEISITPMQSIEETGSVYRDFSKELDSVLADMGMEAVTLGCRPSDHVDDLELIPKRRYRLMDEYFRKSGTGGREMMRGTASLQISIDYRSEDDFRRKYQAAYYYSPIFKLLCDNAEVFQGKPVPVKLMRTDIWRRVDDARCARMPDLFDPDFGFAGYADFIGNMPPIFLKKGHDIFPSGTATVSELFDGKEMDSEDIVHVLSMAFPGVRLKQFIEIRVADSVPYPFILAYCALVKGLLYHDEGLDYAQNMIRGSFRGNKDISAAEDALMKNGWDASVYGIPAAGMAEIMLGIARRNLPQSERQYLDAFHSVLKCGGISKVPVTRFQTGGGIHES
ncbi:MAG: glutamate-cysteine ligase family protein [Lachnospiraceae bacterium]|nr:glutamate-cysteine ligase family protein [Lachnospiraceae bacterium]